MFMVVPSGSTKPAVEGAMPSRSRHAASAAGNVALLELVENAVTSTSLISRKNSRGLRLARNLSQIDIVPNRCSSSIATQPSTNRPSAIRMSKPTLTTTLKIIAGTA